MAKGQINLLLVLKTGLGIKSTAMVLLVKQLLASELLRV
jgi:hypothetical protein